ncbi:MAG: isopentenyl-diphosphate Delta-isomerase [Pedobacter sp.]|nr:MAG: isopentenyl-diphosphate Delta-isomerase [Pedobacter sp.]
MEEQVILVDRNDVELGLMGKMEAHYKGELHRAFSVFIFNSRGELLLQQRASNKYHSPGQWTNTCCSHPRQGEVTVAAAKRRLREEMGMDCQLHYGFNFLYKASFDNNLVEHEFDHVFFGVSDRLPIINKSEVMAYKYMDMNLLGEDLTVNPSHYTAWLNICFDKVLEFKNTAYV